jgi:hypothetical protein
MGKAAESGKELSHSALASGIRIRIKNKICTNPQIKKP